VSVNRAEGDTAQPIVVRELTAIAPEQVRVLAEVLIDCVSGGASVSFMNPLSREKAESFWRRVADGVALGERVVVVAESGGIIVGTVQLILDLPENQLHRADVAKMLVARHARRQGIGALLMAAAEAAARRRQRSLLVLDTADPAAERLYARLGWQRVGVIPDYARLPDGGYCNTTIFHRTLTG
jgi:GNAT superfamily N-acetyltransferase